MSSRIYKLKELVESFSVRAKDVGGSENLQFLGVSNEKGITESKYAAEEKGDDYKIIEKGCFAYNPYRINVGSIAYVEEDIKGLISPAYVLFKVKPNKVLPQLLLMFLKSSEGLSQIKQHARGTVRQALRFEDLCRIEITLPDYDKQTEIIDRYKKNQLQSDSLSTELTHQLTLVKQLRQSFLREAMQGKLTADFRSAHPELTEGENSAQALLNRIAVLTQSTKMGKQLAPINEDEIPFDIPEGWVWCRLGEIALYSNSGKSFKCTETPIEGNQWGVVKVSAVSWDVFLEEQNKLYTKHKPEDISSKIEVGDFLISRANTLDLVGKSVIVKSITKNLLLSDKIIRFKFSENISVDYINYCNNSFYARVYYAEKGSGSSPSMKNITRVHMNELLIPLPPLSEQQAIVSKLDELMRTCDELEASIRTSQKQNEMLLREVLREALEG